jgi:hypothetical protein
LDEQLCSYRCTKGDTLGEGELINTFSKTSAKTADKTATNLDFYLDSKKAVDVVDTVQRAVK